MKLKDKFLLNTADVQELLGIGKNKAYELMHSSAFPSMKLGRTYYVWPQKLEEWLEQYAGKEFSL